MKKIGVSMPLPPPPPDHTVDGAFFAREAERLGFESVWVAEHVTAPVHVTRSQSPFFVDGQVPGFPDPLIVLARVSAATSSIKLGTSVLLAPEHHPVRLAKATATLDLFSGGRLILGVGAGWLEEEAEIMGVDFPHRWTQAREAVLALKALWTGEPAEFHGRYYDFPPVRCLPRPAQQPHPPVLLGGVAPNVLKRVVAFGDGWAPERISPEELKDRLPQLWELARKAGRDPDGLQISVHGKGPDPDVVASYLEAGAERVVVGCPIVTQEREALEHLERIAGTVLPLAQRF
ncbi:MAG: LLM class F420-dependent oxidoreductase [Dehalococcoidia bacterium]